MSTDEKLSATEERLHRHCEARIATGRAAFARIRKDEHFTEWLKVADALAAIREEAMAQAHTNIPQGPRYRAAFRAIDDREAWTKTIDSATRTHCYWLIDNLAAVTAWRETLTGNDRDKWVHPTSVMRACTATPWPCVLVPSAARSLWKRHRSAKIGAAAAAACPSVAADACVAIAIERGSFSFGGQG